MGTSQSSSGPGGKSPLVPPWADDEPQKPLPSPAPKRFMSFRQSLGRFLTSNSKSDLRSALGHYARKATGGGGLASRRLGSVTTAGSALYGVLSGISEGKLPPEFPINLDELKGQPCDIVIETITRSLSTGDGDSEKISAAMNHALVEALDGVEAFDPTKMTDDIIISTMINYLAEAIFLQIVMDAGKTWKKAGTSEQDMIAENALRELIKVVVDKNMAPKLQGKALSLSTKEMKNIQREIIHVVWGEWEGYQ